MLRYFIEHTRSYIRFKLINDLNVAIIITTLTGKTCRIMFHFIQLNAEASPTVHHSSPLQIAPQPKAHYGGFALGEGRRRTVASIGLEIWGSWIRV